MRKIIFLLIACFTLLESSTQTHRVHTHKGGAKHHKYKVHYKNTDYVKYTVSIDSATTNDSSLNIFVNNWIGTNYVWGGTSKSGVDCSGLMKLLYENVYNTWLPRTAEEQYHFTKRVERDSLKTGDLVFFRTQSHSTWHVGIYLINGLFFHASSVKTGVIISSLNTDKYIKEYLSGGEIPTNLISSWVSDNNIF